MTVGFERAVTGEHVKFRTVIQHRTWTVEEVAEQMFQKLKSIDEESKDADDPKDRTSYAKRFTLAKCEEIVRASLKRAKISSEIRWGGRRLKRLAMVFTTGFISRPRSF